MDYMFCMCSNVAQLFLLRIMYNYFVSHVFISQWKSRIIFGCFASYRTDRWALDMLIQRYGTSTREIWKCVGMLRVCKTSQCRTVITVIWNKITCRHRCDNMRSLDGANATDRLHRGGWTPPPRKKQYGAKTQYEHT